jgi:hypothetical protein
MECRSHDTDHEPGPSLLCNFLDRSYNHLIP